MALTSPTSGGRSVGIVRLLTKATKFFTNLQLSNTESVALSSGGQLRDVYRRQYRMNVPKKDATAHIRMFCETLF
jgi:hypothetical protein